MVAPSAIADVSAVVTKYGVVTGTGVFEDDARLRVHVQPGEFDEFWRELEDVTGGDFAFHRDPASPLAHAIAVSAGAEAAADATHDALDDGAAISRAAAAHVIRRDSVTSASSVVPYDELSEEEQARRDAERRAHDRALASFARKRHTETKVKAAVLLLQAAKSGSHFMVHKLVTEGLPVPNTPLTLSMGDVLGDEFARSDRPSSRDGSVQRATADIDAVDDKGNTALMLSCFHGHEVFARLMLELGASTSRKNWDGDNAFKCARKGLNMATLASRRGVRALLSSLPVPSLRLFLTLRSSDSWRRGLEGGLQPYLAGAGQPQRHCVRQRTGFAPAAVPRRRRRAGPVRREPPRHDCTTFCGVEQAHGDGEVFGERVAA